MRNGVSLWIASASAALVFRCEVKRSNVMVILARRLHAQFIGAHLMETKVVYKVYKYEDVEAAVNTK
ncbi:hypothetical protein PAENIP36_49520 [Paenibacillus sp. P36]